MRKVVVGEYLSLDGVGEDPGRIGAFERRGQVILVLDGERPTTADRVDTDFPIDALAYSSCLPPPGP